MCRSTNLLSDVTIICSSLCNSHIFIVYFCYSSTQTAFSSSLSPQKSKRVRGSSPPPSTITHPTTISYGSTYKTDTSSSLRLPRVRYHCRDSSFKFRQILAFNILDTCEIFMGQPTCLFLDACFQLSSSYYMNFKILFFECLHLILFHF